MSIQTGDIPSDFLSGKSGMSDIQSTAPTIGSTDNPVTILDSFASQPDSEALEIWENDLKRKFISTDDTGDEFLRKYVPSATSYAFAPVVTSNEFANYKLAERGQADTYASFVNTPSFSSNVSSQLLLDRWPKPACLTLPRRETSVIPRLPHQGATFPILCLCGPTIMRRILA